MEPLRADTRDGQYCMGLYKSFLLQRWRSGYLMDVTVRGVLTDSASLQDTIFILIYFKDLFFYHLVFQIRR